jgi:hypothetical protein
VVHNKYRKMQDLTAVEVRFLTNIEGKSGIGKTGN